MSNLQIQIPLPSGVPFRRGLLVLVEAILQPVILRDPLHDPVLPSLGDPASDSAREEGGKGHAGGVVPQLALNPVSERLENNRPALVYEAAFELPLLQGAVERSLVDPFGPAKEMGDDLTDDPSSNGGKGGDDGGDVPGIHTDLDALKSWFRQAQEPREEEAA